MVTLLRYRQSVYGRVFVFIPLIFLFFTCFKVDAQTPALNIYQGLQPTELTGANRVAYGNGVYLTCSATPFHFFTSSNCIDWQRIPGPSDTLRQAPAFVFGSGRWVVVADSGKIYSSMDLVSWTKSITNTYAALHDILYRDSTFYAVGDSASLYSSTDGISWARDTLASVDGGMVFGRVVSGNGYLVLAGYTPDFQHTILVRSANGLAGPWSIDTVSQAPNIRYAKGHFYLPGSQVQVSTDAHTWSTLPDLPGHTDAFYDVFADSSRVYLLSEFFQYPDAHNVLYSSADGVNFGSATAINTDGYNAAFVQQRYFVFRGIGFAVSRDTADFLFPGANQVSIATNGSNIVKVSPNDANAFVYTSSDFRNWTLVDTIPHRGIRQAYGVIPQVVYDSANARYTIAGGNAYTSTDGVSWANAGALNVPGLPAMNAQYHFLYGGGTYVSWYADGFPQNNLVWHSSDAVNWNGSALPYDPDNIYDPYPIHFTYNIRYTNNQFFLTDNDNSGYYPGVGEIHGSADGTNFTTLALTNKWPAGFHVKSYDDILYVADSAKYYIFGVGYGPGQPTGFFCVSTPNLADTSITLNNMTVIAGLPPGTVVGDGDFITYGGLHFTYNKGHFIGTVISPSDDPNSAQGYLIWSSDGVHWDSRALNGYTQITSSIVSGDTIRMAGTFNYEIEAVFHESTAALPDSILNFNAVVRGDTSVQLTWQTSTEHNTRAFIVQRRTNDSTGWERIGRIPAAGNSETVTDYSFIDPSPVVGANHYRVRLRYTDSTILTSAVRTVRVRRHPYFNVFPNPAGDHVTVSGPADVQGVITLYDASGRERIQQNFSGSTITLPLGNLRTGAYRLVIRLRDDSRYEQQILHVN